MPDRRQSQVEVGDPQAALVGGVFQVAGVKAQPVPATRPQRVQRLGRFLQIPGEAAQLPDRVARSRQEPRRGRFAGRLRDHPAAAGVLHDLHRGQGRAGRALARLDLVLPARPGGVGDPVQPPMLGPAAYQHGGFGTRQVGELLR